MQFLGLTASTPLYKCWKRAVNETASELVVNQMFKHSRQVLEVLEEKYKCKTLDIQRRSLVDKTVRYVDLEFENEEDLTFFMLRWA